jgi:hypothetical protein
MFHSTSISLFSNMNLKNVRIAIRALAVATLFEGGLAACATNPDSNGHVTISDSATSIGYVRSSRPPSHSSGEAAG